jgi:hypothetical protein
MPRREVFTSAPHPSASSHAAWALQRGAGRARLPSVAVATNAPHLRSGRVVPHVIVSLDGVRAGPKVGSFRKRWAKACREAGGPGLLIHDLRCGGVRSMMRSGISECVVMTTTGHKTRSVFDHYNITSEGNLQEARLSPTGRLPGTIGCREPESCPATSCRGWWAEQGSNLRPRPCKGEHAT